MLDVDPVRRSPSASEDRPSGARRLGERRDLAPLGRSSLALGLRRTDRLHQVTWGDRVADHCERIERYPGTLADLANELGDLRYDALAAFLHALADKLAADAAADAARGRPRLSAALAGGSGSIKAAADHIERAWANSAPHMP